MKLFPIPRQEKRVLLSLNPKSLPFTGIDVWNCYEFTWLNSKGRPEIALLRLDVPCESPCLLESKSLKLYLMSFADRRFKSKSELMHLIKHDLECAAQAQLKISLLSLHKCKLELMKALKGTSLDTLNIACDTYEPNAEFLFAENRLVKETLVSDLLKANCPVTGQPDYASILVRYEGKKINHPGLLRYIVSYRNHSEFHEQSIERMFVDIQKKCAPIKLTVYARYTRRGGIDINPFRTNESRYVINNTRLIRQ